MARPPLERVLWLGVHRDARSIPRVRTVIGSLIDELRRLDGARARRVTGGRAHYHAA